MSGATGERFVGVDDALTGILKFRIQTMHAGMKRCRLRRANRDDSRSLILQKIQPGREDDLGLFDRLRLKLLFDGRDIGQAFFDETFQNLNEELKRTKQENTLELMFAGGWVESFYLTCAHWGIKSSPEIRKRIMEQSASLETLLKTLEPQKSAEGFSTLYPALAEINSIFATTKGAELSDDQVKQLHAKIKTLRNAITH